MMPSIMRASTSESMRTAGEWLKWIIVLTLALTIIAWASSTRFIIITIFLWPLLSLINCAIGYLAVRDPQAYYVPLLDRFCTFSFLLSVAGIVTSVQAIWLLELVAMIVVIPLALIQIVSTVYSWKMLKMVNLDNINAWTPNIAQNFQSSNFFGGFTTQNPATNTSDNRNTSTRTQQNEFVPFQSNGYRLGD